MPSLNDSQNPPQIWPECSELINLGVDWFVVQTCSRWEKCAARELRSLGVGHYLPMQWAQTIAPFSGRINKALKPFFTGYLFAAFRPGQFVDLRYSEYITKTIIVHEPEKLLPELERLRRAIADDVILHPDDFRGGECEVVSGNLAGVRGRAEPTKDRFTFTFIYSLLGQEARRSIEGVRLRAIA